VTFPNLKNFRLAVVKGHRRVFAHTPSVFVQRGITDEETLQMASLSAEPNEGGKFVATAFEVEDEGMDAFIEREEEFDLRMVPYEELDGSAGGLGMLCCCSSDDAYIERWGAERFHRLYTEMGIRTIWDWPIDSGLRPCATYLRHCALAAEKLGPACHDSFLDETFLCCRRLTIRQYLALHPEVLTTLPPESLRERYGG